jgi:hypothetical protein
MGIDDTSRRRGAERLTLVIESGPDTDASELSHLTGQLRRELLELDVEDVELVRTGEGPPGAKVVDPVTIGALAVTLGPTAVQSIVALVQKWVIDRPVRSVKVTLGRDSLELTNASSEQLEQLTRAFIAKHPTS